MSLFSSKVCVATVCVVTLFSQLWQKTSISRCEVIRHFVRRSVLCLSLLLGKPMLITHMFMQVHIITDVNVLPKNAYNKF